MLRRPRHGRVPPSSARIPPGPAGPGNPGAACPESSLAEQIDILRGRKHGQPFLDRRDAAFGLTHGYAGNSREHRIAREPSVPTGIFAGKAVMRDDKGRTGLESQVHLLQRLQALGWRQEMQCQQAGRAIEGPLGGAVDIALVQAHVRRHRAQDRAGEFEHLCGRIDAVELPAGLHFSEGLQFQPAAGAEHQDARVGRCAFGQQHARHPVQVAQARHDPRGSFRIARYSRRVGERRHRARPSACAGSIVSGQSSDR